MNPCGSSRTAYLFTRRPDQKVRVELCLVLEKALDCELGVVISDTLAVLGDWANPNLAIGVSQCCGG